jgi:putative PEP-CTERM system TPR-repeat lipoprotein
MARRIAGNRMIPIRPSPAWPLPGASLLPAIALAAALAALSGCHGPVDARKLQADAERYHRNGENKAAIIELKNLLQREPRNSVARVLLGEAYADTGDAVSAENELRKALALGSAPATVRPLLGRTLLMQGQFEQVLQEFPADSAGLDQSTILLLRADAALGLAKLDQARALYAKVLERQPAASHAILGMARVEAASGNAERAAALVAQALKSEPDDSDALRLSADLLRNAGKNDDAARTYQRILDRQPDNARVHVDLANLQIDMGKFPSAREHIGAARKAGGGAGTSGLLVNQAQATLDFREGNYKAAQQGLQQVLRVAPDFMPAVLLMGAVQLALGAPEQAQQHLQRFLAANPHHVYASKMLATIELQNSRPAAAMVILTPLLDGAASTTEPDLLALAGEAQMRLHHYAESTALFAKAAELAPRSAPAHTALGMSRLAQGDTARAVAELERAASLDTHSARAGTMLVMTHLRARNYEKALVAAEAMEKQAPGDPLAANLKGGVHLARKDLPAARASFERALALDPGCLPALENLARIDVSEGKSVQAIQRLELASGKDPKNLGLVMSLASLMASQGKGAVALPRLQQAYADHGDSVPAATMLTKLYLQAGQPAKALALAEKLRATYPDKPETLALLAQVEADTGKLADAIDNYGRLAALQPASAALQMRLAGLYIAANNTSAALQASAKALAIQPGLQEAQVLQVGLLSATSQFDTALAAARGIQAHSPGLAAGFKLEGDVLMAQARPQAALKLYEKAFGLNRITPLLLKTCHALSLAGRPAEAHERVETWLKTHPADTGARLYLASAALESKQYRLAISQYEAIIAQVPTHTVALNDLAWSYQQEGDPRALAIAERAMASAPDNAAVLDTLGSILSGQGDTARAVTVLHKAVTLAPAAPGPRYHLGVALAKAGDKAAARQQLQQLLAREQRFPDRTQAVALLSSL